MPYYILYPLILAISAAGSALQAASGFGYGIFVMSLLPLFLPYTDALCSSGLIAIFMSAWIGFKHRRHFNYKIIIAPIVAYFVTSLGGTYFIASMADHHLKRILGAVLILLSIYLIFMSDRVKVKPNALTGAAAGALGGFLGSVFGMGGPPIVVYLLSAAEDNETYIANIQIYFSLTNIYISVVRFAGGVMTRYVPLYVLLGVLGIFAGERLGTAIFKKMNPKSLRLTVYSFMIIMGAMFLVTG